MNRNISLREVKAKQAWLNLQLKRFALWVISEKDTAHMDISETEDLVKEYWSSIEAGWPD